MNGDELLAAADRIALGLPRATVSQPFGPDWEVYKVEGKVFQLLTEFHGVHMVTVKADPHDALALRETFPSISAGYHMNKKHWITIRPGGAVAAGPFDEPSDASTSTAADIADSVADADDVVDERLLAEIIAESYRLVAQRLPRSRRPAEIDAFLRAADARED
ncbi:MAG: MmcQ/YjbR family DNA-binding protein [Pseudoclavibacter sp.]